MTITFAEYKQLPKKAPSNNLKEDKKYYIEGTSRRDDKMKTVYIGIYRRNRDGYNHFDEVEYVVNPFHQVGKPHGFDATSGHKFMEVIEIGPTESDYINKNRMSHLQDQPVLLMHVMHYLLGMNRITEQYNKQHYSMFDL